MEFWKKTLKAFEKELVEVAKKLNPSESSDSVRLQKIAQTKSLDFAKIFAIFKYKNISK